MTCKHISKEYRSDIFHSDGCLYPMQNNLTSLLRTFPPLMRQAGAHLSIYWSLIKDFQTGLLLMTAVAGYVTGCCVIAPEGSVGELLGSLFLTISGCTVLNMVYDRDIDACMERTTRRPIPSGQISVLEALWLGILLSAAGLTWAFSIYPLYGGVVLLGWLFNVVLYTIWLKRRTPYSIVLGGLAGGIPILAGEVLAVGYVNQAGLLLMFSVLLWIPTHNLTFSLRHAPDYARAGIPTFPEVYGERNTRLVMAFSTLLAVVCMSWAATLLVIPPILFFLISFLGGVLAILAVAALISPNQKLNYILYKSASIYMAAAMLLLILSGLV
jgi:heme o synthase